MSTIVLYLIALIMGIEGDVSATKPVAADSPSAVETITASREPEDQTPTGKWTTASEVKPILQMTKPSWVAVRSYEGRDLVYFTSIVAMRCALWEVRYGFNDAPADNILPLEPCHMEYASPNAMIEIEDYLPYVEAPSGSVDVVSVSVTFDDGTIEHASFERGDVLIP